MKTKEVASCIESDLAEHWIEDRRLGRFLAVMHSATSNAVEAIKSGRDLPSVYSDLIERMKCEEEYAVLEQELADSIKTDEFAAVLTKMVRDELRNNLQGHR